VTAAAFQGAVAAIVTDRRARASVIGGERIPGLSDDEHDHLRRLAADPGVRVTAELVASFRLGKVLALLPLTREVLGNEAFATEVGRFWLDSPPTSFYLPDEAIAFADHLQARMDAGAINDPLLVRVVAHERSEIVRGHPGRRTTPG
jgi:hypothetical protein